MALRLKYIIAAALTVAAGLAVFFGADALPFALRDGLGDALWAMMVFWLISAALPRLRLGRRALCALLFSFAIEFSQLYHAPAIDAVRETALGHLLLGSDFFASDLLWYTAGVAIALLLDRLLRTGVRTDA